MSSLKSTSTVFKNIILMTRNVENMSSFFTEIIGLRLIHQTPCGKFAELRDASGFKL